MFDQTANPFNWKLPFYGALAAAIAFLPKMVFSNDIGSFLMIGAAAIIGVIVLGGAIRKMRSQTLSALSMLAVFSAFSWFLIRFSDDIRTTCRWLIHSRSYKAEVLALPNSASGELKHIEWDGWGFAGAGDTTVYLVFDPNDTLALAARSHSPGKFSGIPCEVFNVHRLEDHWYTALFYTNTDWDHCN